MEMIVFIGLPGAGKTTYYQQTFSKTHAHVNRDLLGSNRIKHFLHTCFATEMSFVYDNTNIVSRARRRLIQQAQGSFLRPICYWFDVSLNDALNQNALREGKARVPEHAIRSMDRQLEPPSWDEGWESIVRVQVIQAGEEYAHIVEHITDEVGLDRAINGLPVECDEETSPNE